jgi:hypothetical protein
MEAGDSLSTAKRVRGSEWGGLGGCAAPSGLDMRTAPCVSTGAAIGSGTQLRRVKEEKVGLVLVLLVVDADGLGTMASSCYWRRWPPSGHARQRAWGATNPLCDKGNDDKYLALHRFGWWRQIIFAHSLTWNAKWLSLMPCQLEPKITLHL